MLRLLTQTRTALPLAALLVLGCADRRADYSDGEHVDVSDATGYEDEPDAETDGGAGPDRSPPLDVAEETETACCVCGFGDGDCIAWPADDIDGCLTDYANATGAPTAFADDCVWVGADLVCSPAC